jgi:hypothetical protein
MRVAGTLAGLAPVAMRHGAPPASHPDPWAAADSAVTALLRHAVGASRSNLPLFADNSGFPAVAWVDAWLPRRMTGPSGAVALPSGGGIALNDTGRKPGRTGRTEFPCPEVTVAIRLCPSVRVDLAARPAVHRTIAPSLEEANEVALEAVREIRPAVLSAARWSNVDDCCACGAELPHRGVKPPAAQRAVIPAVREQTPPS